MATDGAMGNGDGVIDAGLGAGVLQPVGIPAGVAEFQRVVLDRLQRDGFEHTLVEGHGEPGLRRQRGVVSAGRAAIIRLFELAVENHLSAGLALDPQIVGNVVRGHKRLDFRQNRVGDPVHELIPSPLPTSPVSGGISGRHTAK